MGCGDWFGDVLLAQVEEPRQVLVRLRENLPQLPPRHEGLNLAPVTRCNGTREQNVEKSAAELQTVDFHARNTVYSFCPDSTRAVLSWVAGSRATLLCPICGT